VGGLGVLTGEQGQPCGRLLGDPDQPRGWRTPQPSARWCRTARALSWGSLELNRGVPWNSESHALQALQ
jgi:hypothetical protein